MAAPQAGTLGHPLRHTAARINAPTEVEADGRGVRMAPGAGQPTPGAKRPHEPVAQVRTRGPESRDLMEALERQLHEADARLKAVYSRSWVSGAPDSTN